MYLLRRSWGISEAHSIEKTRMNSRAQRLRVSEKLCAASDGAHFGHIAIATGETTILDLRPRELVSEETLGERDKPLLHPRDPSGWKDPEGTNESACRPRAPPRCTSSLRCADPYRTDAHFPLEFLK